MHSVCFCKGVYFMRRSFMSIAVPTALTLLTACSSGPKEQPPSASFPPILHGAKIEFQSGVGSRCPATGHATITVPTDNLERAFASKGRGVASDAIFLFGNSANVAACPTIYPKRSCGSPDFGSSMSVGGGISRIATNMTGMDFLKIEKAGCVKVDLGLKL